MKLYTEEKIALIASYIFILFLMGFFIYLVLTCPLFLKIIAIINVVTVGFFGILLVKFAYDHFKLPQKD